MTPVQVSSCNSASTRVHLRSVKSLAQPRTSACSTWLVNLRRLSPVVALRFSWCLVAPGVFGFPNTRVHYDSAIHSSFYQRHASSRARARVLCGVSVDGASGHERVHGRLGEHVRAGNPHHWRLGNFATVQLSVPDGFDYEELLPARFVMGLSDLRSDCPNTYVGRHGGALHGTLSFRACRRSAAPRPNDNPCV